MNWKTPILREVQRLELQGLWALNNAWPGVIEAPESPQKEYRLKVLGKAIEKAEKAKARQEKAVESARKRQAEAIEREKARIERLRASDPYFILEGSNEERKVELVLSAFERGQGKVYARWVGARASVVLEAARKYARTIAARVGRVYLRDGLGPLEEVYP